MSDPEVIEPDPIEPEWTTDDEAAFAGLLDRRGFKVEELRDWIAALGPDLRSTVITDLLRRDPKLGRSALFSELKADHHKAQAAVELERLVARDAAREAHERLTRGSAGPVVLRSLDRTVERLRDGSAVRPTPSVGGLLYPSRVNAVYGTHTAGKTWLSLHLARLNMEAGGTTLVIDYEDSEVGVADRCRAMDDRLAKSVRYYAPEGRFDAADLERAVRAEGVTLIILDSVGESLAMGGYDSNAERDVTQWFTEVPDALAALGPAVLVIDHVAKRQDGTPSPVGSFRKSAAITGAQFALENKVGFSRERAGWSKLTCTKDRNGYFATGEVVGRVTFTPGDDTMDVGLDSDLAEAEVFSRIERDVLGYVQGRMAEVHGQRDENGDEMDGRPNITQIRGAVSGKATAVRAAVDTLVERGWLAVEHTKLGKTTRDVYVPADPGFDAVTDDEDDLL